MDGYLFGMDDDGMDAGAALPVETPGGFVPFPYQSECDEAIWQTLQEEDRTNICVATGCGKTEIACLGFQRDWGGGKLFIVNRQEIVEQTAARFKQRGIDCEVEMGERTSDAEVTVASYQSLIKKNRAGRRRVERYFGQAKVAYIDEYHSYYSPLLLEMLADLRTHNCKTVAMTASPPNKKKNADSGQYELLSTHFGEPCFTYDYLQAVRDGYLCDVRQHLVLMRDFDLSKVRDSFGDYNQTAVSKILNMRHMIAGVGQMIEDYWEGMPSVVFASDIAHAENIAEELRGRGIEASIVHSDMDRMSTEERRMHLDDYNSGRSNIIINVGILTMGWDSPRTRKLFIARCTKSLPLYLQIFGRGTRTLLGPMLAKLKTAEERKAAIAASAKPYFEVFDITDSTRNCSIKNALDVLFPSLEDRLMVQVRERSVSENGFTGAALDKIVQQEAALLRKQEEAALRHALRSRLGIEVTGEVTAYHRELLADAELQRGQRTKDYWWMPWGKYKGKGFRAIHGENPGYLAYMLDKGYLKDPGLRKNVITFLTKAWEDSPQWAQGRITAALNKYTG